MLLGSLDFDAGKAEGEKLKYLLKNLSGLEKDGLVKTVLDGPSLEFIKILLKMERPQRWMQAHLLELTQSRSPEVATLATRAVEKLGG